MAETTLPPGAYEAACAAGIGAQDPIRAGLLAAAKYFRDQERERIRRLAINAEATCRGDGIAYAFADLLDRALWECP